MRAFAEQTSEEAGFTPASSSEMAGSPRDGTSRGAIHVKNKLVNLIVKPAK